MSDLSNRFGTIRNNTALKPEQPVKNNKPRFGTIRNNTALKHSNMTTVWTQRFGTIRNNTALKLTPTQSAKKWVLEPFETTQL